MISGGLGGSEVLIQLPSAHLDRGYPKPAKLGEKGHPPHPDQAGGLPGAEPTGLGQFGGHGQTRLALKLRAGHTQCIGGGLGAQPASNVGETGGLKPPFGIGRGCEVCGVEIECALDKEESGAIEAFQALSSERLVVISSEHALVDLRTQALLSVHQLEHAIINSTRTVAT